MRKNVKTVILLLTTALLLTFCGCSKSNFSVAVKEDNTAEIKAEQSTKDMFGGAGTMTVKEGEKLVVESNLEKGSIKIHFAQMSEASEIAVSTVSEIIPDENDSALEITISGKETSEYDIDPGDYFISATVLEKANGEIKILPGSGK